MRLLAQLCEEFPIDQDRVLLTGYSMGAAGVWEIGVSFHSLFAGLVSVSGYVPRSTGTLQFSYLKDTPVWVFHGARDDRVACLESEKVVSVLRALGVPVDFTLLPEGDHFIADAVFSEPKLHEWLLQRRRNSVGAQPFIAAEALKRAAE
jgi:predicted peptidase